MNNDLWCIADRLTADSAVDEKPRREDILMVNMQATDQPDRVAVYARVSSEDQAERGTIENQLEFARKYCDLHQLQVIEWYQDDGVTGTLPLEQREAGSRLLADAKAGRFDLLLIYRLDRLGQPLAALLP
mgnify:CR=1 FL=1